jgi:hypothetical protein
MGTYASLQVSNGDAPQRTKSATPIQKEQVQVAKQPSPIIIPSTKPATSNYSVRKTFYQPKSSPRGSTEEERTFQIHPPRTSFYQSIGFNCWKREAPPNPTQSTQPNPTQPNQPQNETNN